MPLIARAKATGFTRMAMGKQHSRNLFLRPSKLHPEETSYVVYGVRLGEAGFEG